MPKEETLPIQITNAAGQAAGGTITVHRWSGAERRTRALKIMGKTFAKILILPCVAIFVHILIIPTLITLTVSLIGSPIFYSYLAGQDATFLHAEGKCPNCGASGRLNPYLWRTYSTRMTLLCPSCGQTCYGESEAA